MLQVPSLGVRSGRRAAQLCCVLGLLSSFVAASAGAAGGSPFPHTRVIGWAKDGALATLTMASLGKGEIRLHRTPERVFPVKAGGLCVDAPRWSCRLEMHPTKPELASEEWVESVRSELRLAAPRSGKRGEGGLYRSPAGIWAVEVARQEGPLPRVNLLLESEGLRFVLWQAIFQLAADAPLEVSWHPRLPKAAVVARSVAAPYPRKVLVAEADLADPVGAEARSLTALAAQLRGRRNTTVKLAPVVEELRVRSQRRVELGSILVTAAGDTCGDSGEPAIVLDARAFDLADAERGALLSYGCPRAAAPDEGRLVVSHALFLRSRGRWQLVGRFLGKPEEHVRARLVDLTLDSHPELWLLWEGPTQSRFEAQGWHSSRVEAVLEGSFEAQCLQDGPAGRWRSEELVLGQPVGSGRLALVLHRRWFATRQACLLGRDEAKVLQHEQTLWRWNKRLKRFYRRSKVLVPAGRDFVAGEPGTGRANAADDAQAASAPPAAESEPQPAATAPSEPAPAVIGPDSEFD